MIRSLDNKASFIKEKLVELQFNLEHAIKTFEKKAFYVLSVKSTFMLAKIHFQLENFIESRQKVIVVINASRELQLKET